MDNKACGIDRLRIRIQGESVHRFVNLAASEGIRMAHLQCKDQELVAWIFGRDLALLQQMAKTGHWSLTVERRVGPGRLLERLSRRPGILAGALVGWILLLTLSHYIWVIDFGNLEGETAERLRGLLTEYGICEGAWLQKEQLEQAQTAALQQSDLFGWISLNFTAGCLAVESTPAEQQTIRQAPSMQALYAKEKAEIVSIQAQSGFTVVEPGQQVEKGQLLVDVVRLDRNGEAVPQGASGAITALVEKQYTFSQPYEMKVTALTGQRVVQESGTLLGYQWNVGEELTPSAGILTTEWQPLSVGRITLPGSVCVKTLWQQQEQVIQYTPEQAEALVQRHCRQQLYAEFPDAVIQWEQAVCAREDTAVSGTVTYRFLANIAEKGS